jgi:hypothetical protein
VNVFAVVGADERVKTLQHVFAKGVSFFSQLIYLKLSQNSIYLITKMTFELILFSKCAHGREANELIVRLRSAYPIQMQQ